MKTAMQEAIEIIEERLKILSIVQRTESTMGAIAGYQYSKYLLMELLEKEKEQIVDACNANLKGLLTNGKDYYDLNFNHQEVTSDTPSNYQRGWNAAQRGLLQNDAWGDTYTDNANNRPSHEELDEWIKGWKAYRYSNEMAKGKPVAIQGHTFN